MEFKYATSFLPVAYDGSKPKLPLLTDDSNCQDHLNQMGRECWELVSVQPLLFGDYYYGHGKTNLSAYGYSLTFGYYFFWKKAIQ
jgi:hypothetical protein